MATETNARLVRILKPLTRQQLSDALRAGGQPIYRIRRGYYAIDGEVVGEREDDYFLWISDRVVVNHPALQVMTPRCRLPQRWSIQ